MSKGLAALSYLPAVDIQLDASGTHTLEAIVACVHAGAKAQLEGLADGDYNGVPTNITPYNQGVCDISVAASGAEFTIAPVTSSNDLPVTGGVGNSAMSARRNVTVALANGGNETFTFRSLLALLNFVGKLEDRVAETGNGAEGDATYTDIIVKGHSPYETFQWTVVKLGNAYTVTPTANS